MARSLQAVLDHSVAIGETSFAVGALSRDGEVVFEGSAGEATPGRSATTDTIFRLDSITKPLTAAAVMILVDQGRIKLDDPVSDYVPAFADAEVALTTADEGAPTLIALNRRVAVRDLLTHTAGLAGYSPETDALWASKTNLEFAEGMARMPLRHHPGEGFQYGNAYEVLPAVIAVASGLPFDTFIEKYILAPLEMRDTHFVVPADKRSRYAAIFTKDKDGKLIAHALPSDPETEDFPSGGGGLKSTVGDYRRFAEMLLNGGARNGVRILSEHSVREMTAPQVDADVSGAWQGDYAWGYGLAVRRSATTDPADKKALGSFGWNGGYGTQIFVDPKNRLVGVVATQMQYGNDFDLRERFEEAAYSIDWAHSPD